MKEVILQLVKKPEVECEMPLTPTDVVNKKVEEIEEIEVNHGNKSKEVGHFFQVTGETANEAKNQQLSFEGDLSKFKSIGKEMNGGKIVIEGDAGFYTGAGMKTGKIVVKGDVSAFCGVEKTGGDIVIHGGAGPYLGGALRGSRKGMTGGSIEVNGSVENECGAWMTGGSIKIGGNAGPLLGVHMSGGEIKVEGNSGKFVGNAMTRGKIKINGDTQVMASFIKQKDEEMDDQKFKVYSGDTAEDGEGKILIKKT